MPSDIFSQLNLQQREAVSYTNGSSVILAGAGSGKTRVLVYKVLYLIKEKKVDPYSVLMITFTNKAAGEMKERILRILNPGSRLGFAGTFHSFCAQILRRNGEAIGLTSRFNIYDENDQLDLIKQILKKMESKKFTPSYFLNRISAAKNQLISEKKYLELFSDYNASLVAEVYSLYQKGLEKNKAVDFDDLLVKTVDLFIKNPVVLTKYQERYRYILVDEFQDTNYAQNELAIILAGKSRNLTVCGDDDQSIYRFRGAAVSNIVQFRKNFKRSKVVVLTKNYRSTQEILDRAYGLIQNNNPDRLEAVEKIDKRLTSQVAKDGEEITFIHADRVENEADLVAKKIEEVKTQGHYDWKDFAILVRANAHSEPFGRALSRHGIPSQFLGPGRLFRQPEIVDLISYLKVIYNFEDSVSFYRLLSLEYFDVSSRDLAAIGNYAKRYNLSLFEACEKIDDIFVGKETKKKVKKLLEIILKHLKLARRETAGQLLYYFLQGRFPSLFLGC